LYLPHNRSTSTKREDRGTGEATTGREKGEGESRARLCRLAGEIQRNQAKERKKTSRVNISLSSCFFLTSSFLNPLLIENSNIGIPHKLILPEAPAPKFWLQSVHVPGSSDVFPLTDILEGVSLNEKHKRKRGEKNENKTKARATKRKAKATKKKVKATKTNTIHVPGSSDVFPLTDT
jgi:hypothetical protein